MLAIGRAALELTATLGRAGRRLSALGALSTGGGDSVWKESSAGCARCHARRAHVEDMRCVHLAKKQCVVVVDTFIVNDELSRVCAGGLSASLFTLAISLPPLLALGSQDPVQL